jgi:hypothetical protein
MADIKRQVEWTPLSPASAFLHPERGERGERGREGEGEGEVEAGWRLCISQLLLMLRAGL